MIDKGHIKPVIDRSYLLGQIVQAHEFVGKGYKREGIAITEQH